MRKYEISVNGIVRIIPAYSAKQAITKMLRSIIGTRTADKMMPLTIIVKVSKAGDTG